MSYLMGEALEMVAANPGWVLTNAGLTALAARLLDLAAKHPYWPRLRLFWLQELGNYRPRLGQSSADPMEYGAELPMVALVRRCGEQGEADKFAPRRPYYAFTLRMREPYGSVAFYIGVLERIVG